MDKKTLAAVLIGVAVTAAIIYIAVLRAESSGRWNEKKIEEYKKFQQQRDEWEKEGNGIISNTDSR